MGTSAMRLPAAVGQLLRSRRKEMGLTLREASATLASRGERVPVSTLGRIEQGKLDPGVRRLYKLLDLYQIQPHLVADLVELESIAAPPPTPKSLRDLERLHKRGLEFWKRGNVAKALACLFAVRQYVPGTPEAARLRQRANLAFATAARNLGKYRLARQIVDDLLCEPPDRSLVVQVLTLGASLWRGLGSIDAALAFVRQAESRLGDVSGIEVAWVQHQKSKLLSEIGQLDEADAALDIALARYREIADATGEMRALVLRTAIREQQGRYDEALDVAEEVIRWSERHGLARGVLYGQIDQGRLQVHTGSAETGIETLSNALGKAVNLKDHNAEFLAHYHLWKAHERSGDTDRARFELQAAKHFVGFIDERFPEADEIRNILNPQLPGGGK